MRNVLKLSDRLIIAADFDPRPCGGSPAARAKLERLVKDLAGTGVTIKVNSILRRFGYDLIDFLHQRNVRVMADLKLVDIPETIGIDSAFLAEFNPYLLTVMTQATEAGLQAVQVGLGQREKDTLAWLVDQLSQTEILGVTVLTSQGGNVCRELYGRDVATAVADFATMAHEAGIGGLVLSGKEVPIVQGLQLDPPMTLNTPGSRPLWSLVPGDDQDPERVTTPAKAIRVGATRIIIGRPVTGAKPNDEGRPQSPREAVERILEEIETALSEAPTE